MNIAYVANVRMPTEKAHGAQIAKTCEAFVKNGASVELVVPKRVNAIVDDVAAYYGLKESFKVTYVFAPNVLLLGQIGFLVMSLWFGVSTFLHLRSREKCVIYGRDEIVLAVLSLFGNEVVWESHTGAWNAFARFVTRRAKTLVVISNGLRDFYIKNGVPEEKIVVAHDAIDLALFATAESKGMARARLGLTENEKIIMYVGGLGGWKGVGTLLEASNDVAEQVVIIGGTSSEVSALKEKYPQVLFLGERPYRELQNNLAAADILVLPNTAKDTRARLFTSPLKLFAYMAAEKPIVASDIPSTREVLPEEAAFWFKPDDAKDLARVIQEALRDSAALEKAHIARLAVGNYTWEKRAQHILSHLS